MKKSLYDEINDALKDRGDWAERQQANYTMRNGGIRRRSKPYPNAPDGWSMLGDTMIEKMKPPYIGQLYTSETICTFVCLKDQDETLTRGAEGWYDYQLKQRSNFERTMFVGIDQMLEQAFTPIKVYWDATAKRLAFDQVDPLHLIVPNSCQEYNQNGGTDWMVHVLHMSVAEYRANSKFKQDEDFIKRIKGKGNKEDSDSAAKQDSVDLKEGINCSNDDNEVVLWEVSKRDRRDKKIEIETISPLLPCDEEKNVVRPSFGMPYNKGCFKDGEHFPFFKIRAEIKGKGHYSSRGIIEVNAPWEMALNKILNTNAEWQDFFSKPLFENSGVSAIPSAANFKTKPGAILPVGLTAAVMPSRPQSLQEDLNLFRALAEDRTQVPSLGANQHIEGSSSSGKPTATQINAIVGQSGQGNDMRARVFKLDLGEGLQMGWSIAQQYLLDQLMYLADGQRQSLDQNALHEEYEIVPNGSADSWNKGQMVQKRMAYYQTLLENPYIDVAELTKWLLEADDPKMVKRLFKDPQQKTKGQEEQQIMECLAMMEGFVPDVNKPDDDKTHLMIQDQFALKKIQSGQMTPELAQGMIAHGIQHMGALKEKKDPMLKQVEAKLQPTAEILAQYAAQVQQQPGNVVPMSPDGQQAPGAMPGTMTQPVGTAPAQPSVDDPNTHKVTIAVGNNKKVNLIRDPNGTLVGATTEDIPAAQ